MEAMKQAFETVAMAKVSTSAIEARNLGFLSPGDNVTMNRERVLSDAKERALGAGARGLASADASHTTFQRRARASWRR